jgi:DegV family protein with EDD domain
MPARVAVVTDSTANLPDDLVRRHDVSVVPLQVVIGGKAHNEGVDVTSQEVAEALRSHVPVSTSRPGPATFLDVYRAAAERGANAVVSVHLSADMSGTHQSAVIASRDAPLPIRVVDSRTLGMALGYAVVAAAERAAAGASLDDVAAAAEARARASFVFFYVDTLEHLRRGGRIGAAQALLGSALMVKPLLHLVDGRIAPLDKVRTSSRAIARLEELAVDKAAELGAVDIAVHHLTSLDRANALADRLRQRIERLGELRVSEVGAVVGAHVGPGMLAVVISPRDPATPVITKTFPGQDTEKFP